MNLKIYAGRQLEGPYNIDNSPDKVTKRLVQPILNTRHNLTVHDWYTHLSLAEDLQKKIVLVGTIIKIKENYQRNLHMIKIESNVHFCLDIRRM